MQNERDSKICMLCLKSSERDLETVKTVTIKILESLGLRLNGEVFEKPALCKSCSENLERRSDFKTACLYTEDRINSFKIDRNNVELDLEEIYLRINENKNIAMPEYDTICRLCMNIAKSGHYVALHGETKDAVSVKMVLERCFSELDLDVTGNPAICTSCIESLHTYFSFIKNRLEVKNETEQYCKIEERNNKLQVELNSELKFETGIIPNYKNDYTYIDIHKDWIEAHLYGETKFKLENLTEKESQDLQIKHEVNEHSEVGDVEEKSCSNVAKRCHENKQIGEIELKCESFVGTINMFNIKHEEIDIKTEDKMNTVRFQDDMQILKSNIEKCQCEECDYKTNSKRDFEIHMLIHRNDSQIRKNQCEKTTYQCDACTFKTRYKSVLNRHMLLHKSSSEVALYSCGMCTYKTKRKCHLQQHMLAHKNASEVATYSCEMCIYRTKRKNDLKKHMAVHKAAFDVTTDQCDMVVVDSKQDTKTTNAPFSCEICRYETRRKWDLKRHMLIHKNASEVTTYSCEICTYETKRKGDLQQHLLTHKNSSEVSTYQCDVCSFSTKYKQVIKQHVLRHIDTDEAPMYSCKMCAHKTKQKSSLKKHMLIHKNPSEVTSYFCAICAYKTKRKSHLKQHMLIHKHPSEVTTYQCDICTFRTIHKSYLKKHVSKHRNSPRVTT